MRNFKWFLTYNGTTEEAFPADWQKVGLSYERHRTYHGVLRSYTLPVRFPKRSGYGGDFIINAYDSEGLGAIIEIEGRIFNGQTNDYDLFYKGIIDMKPDSITFTKDYVEVSIIDGSKENKFITRDEIEYDLFKRVSTDGVTTPAFSDHPKDVTFKPIDIILIAEADFSSTYDGQSLGVTLGGTDIPNSQTQGVQAFTETINEFSENLEFVVDQLQIYENGSSEQITINVTDISGTWLDEITVTTISGPNESIRFDSFAALKVYDSDGVEIEVYSIFEDNITPIATDGDYSQSGSFSDNTSFDIPPGGRIDFIHTIAINSGSTVTNVRCDSNVTISTFDLQQELIGVSDTTAKSFMLHEAFTRLIALQTSETDTSNIFESKAMGRTDSEFKSYGSRLTVLSNIALSNGFLIRKFPSPALNVSFKELFQSADSIYPIGLGYDRDNDVFYIERRQDFYKGEFMFDLGDVDELEVMPLPDMYYNRIHAGYDGKVEYEEINGAKEFNTANEHSIPITVKEDLRIQSKYRIDSIGMELARRKQYSKFASTDTRYDEDNFMVYVDTPGYITEQGYGSPSGFLGVENYYNIRISPRENLLRHARFINSTLWKSDKDIKFVNSQKNIDFQYTTFRGDAVNQIDDIAESETSFYSELFRPEIHKLKSYINKERIEKLNSDPHGYIQYSFNGNQYQGFLHKLETEEYNKLATFEIIPKGSFTNQSLLAEDGETITSESGSGLITE